MLCCIFICLGYFESNGRALFLIMLHKEYFVMKAYVGFSSALGSSLPNPAGCFSDSSVDMRISSASTLPCKAMSITELSDSQQTWSRSSSFSSLAYKGHQPFVLFCLNRFIVGTEPSVLSMPKLHCLAVLAPRGNLFRSKVIEPRKSS